MKSFNKPPKFIFSYNNIRSSKLVEDGNGKIMPKIISSNRAKNIINICLVLSFFKTIKKIIQKRVWK